MADLTILSSLPPIPVYPSRPSRSGFSSQNPSYASFSSSRLNLTLNKSSVNLGGYAQAGPSRPRLSQLDLRKGSVPSTPEEAEDGEGQLSMVESPEEEPEAQTPRQPGYIHSPIPQPALQQNNLIVNSNSKPRSRRTHRPTRSRSAPPERTEFGLETTTAMPTMQQYDIHDYAHSEIGSSRRRARHNPDDSSSVRSGTSDSSASSPISISSWSYDSPTRPWHQNHNEIMRPPPPLHRPTTFWRRTPRSGVTSSCYSPSTHLIRRSTFIAAGLGFERPEYDGSALAVESRMPLLQQKLSKPTEVFWEVIVPS